MTRLSAGAGTFISEDINIVIGNLMFSAFSAIGLITILLVREDTTGKILTNSIDRTGCRTPGVDSSFPITKGQLVVKYDTVDSK